MEIIKNIRIERGLVQIDGVVDFRFDKPDFKPFAKGIYKYYGIDYAKFYKMSALSKLGFLASELLLMGMDLSNTDPAQFSLFMANASSSLHTDATYQETIGSKPSPAIFVYTLPNILIGEVCIRNGFMGEGIFFIQESFDKDFLFEYAENHLNMHPGAISLTGWVDIDMHGEYLADLYLLK